jgi:hypothetical protein
MSVLMNDNKRKLLLVHPHATEQIRPLFKEQLRNQLTCLDKYFAKESYSDVNKEIAEALLNLANA